MSLLSFLVIAGLSHARAQDDAERARVAFDRGVRTFQENNFSDALEAFQEAYRLRPHPAVQVNIANCFLNLDRPVEASTHFQQYLQEAGDSVPRARRTEVEQELERARAEIATLAITGPPGVGVSLDDTSRGVTPLEAPIEINPGTHRVVLTAPDGRQRTERIIAVDGQRIALDVGALPTAGSESAIALPVAAPPHPNEPSDRSDGPGVPVGTWIAGGTALVALGVAIVFGANALSQASEFDSIVEDIQSRRRNDPQIPRLQAEGQAVADAQERNALIADISLGVAAVSATIAIVLWLTADEGGDSPPVSAAIEPHGAAVFWQVYF